MSLTQDQNTVKEKKEKSGKNVFSPLGSSHCKRTSFRIQQSTYWYCVYVPYQTQRTINIALVYSLYHISKRALAVVAVDIEAQMLYYKVPVQIFFGHPVVLQCICSRMTPNQRLQESNSTFALHYKAEAKGNCASNPVQFFCSPPVVLLSFSQSYDSRSTLLLLERRKTSGRSTKFYPAIQSY